MATNITNTAPYFDDFDKSKNFHQIVFRPGFAVQARELTQIQSIIKNQIEQFGNHIFRQGSIVIPGNSRGDLYVPFAKISPTHNSITINTSLFDGATVKGQTSGVTGIIRKVVDATTSDPITFYINYMSGGVVDDVSNGALTFVPGEVLTINGTAISCTIQSDPTSVGIGSIAYVNTGVYYVNGTFVHVDAQSTVLSKYSSTPSCHVLLKIVEELVTSEDDATLLDPAQGSYNFAAPGADRYKLSLELTTLPIDSVIDDNYVEIMRYRNGILEEHARNPKYNELEKSLARRTYDESGDYVVNGLYGVITEHKRESSNGGLYEDGDINKFAVTVVPGKAYIKGFEVEKISPTVFSLDKARTSAHIGNKDISSKLEYGRYIYVTNVRGNLGISSRSEFTLYNDSDRLNTSATNMGTGRIIAIDYHAGTPSTNGAIYKLYYSSIELSENNEFINVGGIRIGNDGATASATVLHKYDSVVNTGVLTSGDVITSTSGTRTATVHFWDQSMSEVYVYKHDHTKQIPKVGDLFSVGLVSAVVRGITNIFTAGQSTTLFQLPASVVKSIRNISGSYNHRYIVQKQVTIVTNSSGDGSVTISDGTFNNPEVGTFSAFTSSGVVDTQLFSVSGSGTQLIVDNGPTSSTITIVCAVEKMSLSPRTKTLMTGVTTIASYSSTQRTFSLNHADVYELQSVADSTGTITANFTLVNGQTDYFYNNSSIQLKNSITPIGTITVTYKYFSHSAGDFFTFDSYATNPGYENFVLTYKTSTGDVIDLRNYLDFRSTWNGTTYNTSDMIVNGEWFRSPLQFYMGRYDLLVINKDGNANIITGVPSDNPTIPSTPTDALSLEHYFVPPFTKRVSDIRYTRYQVKRFTMSDITRLANRVQRVEEFSTLNATENELVSYDVMDAATGLSRFKTGFLVETFTQPLTIADVTSAQFRSTFDKGVLTPSMDTMICPVTVQNLSNNTLIIKNSVAMLPYVEKVFAQQGVSSRVTNLNPFMVVKWDGTLTITPSSDSWVETLDLPNVFSQTTETIVMTTWLPAPVAPVPAPVPAPAPAPLVLPDNIPIIIPIPFFTPAPVPAAPPTPPITPPPVVIQPAISNDGTGDGGSAGVDGGNGDGAGGGGGGGDCFTADTLVTMADGSQKRIDEIIIGDVVENFDGTSYNTVTYIERVINDKLLYSPTDSLEPFATINHPLGVIGKELKCVNSTITNNLYPWLNIDNHHEYINTIPHNNEYVYNLWLDGDNTYKVNGMWTHTIIGDGGAIRNAIMRDHISHDTAMSIIRKAQQEYYTHIGSYVLNNIMSRIPIVGNVIIKGLARDDKVSTLLYTCIKVVGYVSKILYFK